MLFEIVIVLVVLGYFTYQRYTKNFDYFEKRGVPYVKPIPFIGSFTGFIFRNESFYEELVRRYKEHRNSKVFGIFEGDLPRWVINDLELLKKIAIKDFDHFRNHKFFIEPDDDPLFGNSLLIMKDEKWHDMRVTLSPAFTGNKMRMMYQLLLEICEHAVQNLKKRLENKPDGMDLEMKNFFTLYTNDAIASVAFGLDINSLENENNEFYIMGQKLITFTTWDSIKFVLNGTFKRVFKFFGISLAKKEFNNYFSRLVIDAMKYRKEHNIIRQDMINILIEAQSNQQKLHGREWTNDELVAQCFIFFFAGLESVSTTLSFAVQELIENLEVQEKLRNEINSLNEKLNGERPSYDDLKSMKYMDMVVSEVLRKWPPFVRADRECTKDYDIEEDDLKISLKAGDGIWFPTIGLHMDENYFTEPQKFDPERFNDENKNNIKPMSYMPFSVGPRICIGQRIALLEIKAILFYLLRDFTLHPCSKSDIPIQLAPTNFPVVAKNGYWLRIAPKN